MLRFSLHAPASAYMSASRPCLAQIRSIRDIRGRFTCWRQLFSSFSIFSPNYKIFGIHNLLAQPNNSALCLLHSALFKRIPIL